MSSGLFDIPVRTIDGRDTTLGEHAGKVLLVVNVASQCGLTPQYGALQQLHEKYEHRGFTVLGFPCNQFGAQEPGTPDEIVAFCSSYGVIFPLYEKVEVNGDHRHPLYDLLVRTTYVDGEAAGDITWNFEKFVVSPGGDVTARFKPRTEPDSADIVAIIEANLPS